jgi:hypothetical protein
MATPLQLNPYVGILLLDSGAFEAFLGQHDSSGNPIQSLMMIDTAPSGGFDPVKVRAAYELFSGYPNAGNRPTITIVGFYSYVPGTTQPLLHVVRS